MRSRKRYQLDRVAVTPLQLAQAYATLANEGKICQPHVVDRIVDDTGETVKKVSGHCGERTVPYTQDQLDYILDALTNVPKLGGTAYSAFQGFPLEQYPIAGKTGTAFRGYPFQAGEGRATHLVRAAELDMFR